MTAYTYFMPNTQMRRICAWLKSLDAETLRSYFGFSLNPKGIDHLINNHVHIAPYYAIREFIEHLEGATVIEDDYIEVDESDLDADGRIAV